MTVSITSSLRVALVSGSGVNFNAPVVQLISTDDVYNPDNPAETLTDLLDAISSAKLAGSATINGAVVGNTSIYTVPAGEKFFPTSVVFALTNAVGSGNGPAINAGFTSALYDDYIDSTESTHYDLSGGAIFAAGSGYHINDVLTLSGGTVISSDNATITVNSSPLVGVTLNAAGTIYAPGDTITLAGGVPASRAILTVSTVKLVSATVTGGASGTGYDSGGGPSTFDVTVFGGTAGTAAVVNVTTDGSGVVNTVNSITTAGSYSLLPSLSANAATGDDGVNHGAGLALDLVFGVNTFTISTAGEYTTQTSSFTQFASSGFGTGATFNIALYGVLAYTISNDGTYTVLPSNHVSVSGGAGAGATFDATWETSQGSFMDVGTIGQLVEFTDFANDGSNFAYMTGGEVVTIRVQFPAEFSTYTMKAFVFGFSFS